MIERTFRGVSPLPTITAPLPKLPRDNSDPDLRLAYFRQSAAVRTGLPIPKFNQFTTERAA